MEVMATAKFVRLSPTKVRDLATKVRGLTVAEAMRVVDINSRKGAFHLGKVLKSAIANAENNEKLSVDDLKVKDAVVDNGPMQKRYWSRARGAVSHILKRTCHITVVLTDGVSAVGENAENTESVEA
ncbi:MAG: 50S ribosomal protein L22 [Kiritimatiellae bacterium]|nr:50S ribosomal protein L22 [Kiritimatiellia bacterium]